MRKFFTLLMVPFVMLAVSCSTDDGNDDGGNGEAPRLTLTSEGVMRFPAEGGSGEINYTLENVGTSVELSVASGAEWITNISSGNVVTFDVAANDTTDERSAVIILSYKGASVQVIVEQQGQPDEEFLAGKLNGQFYGKQNNNIAYQYGIVLSKYGTTGSDVHYAGDTYYHFNIYSSVPSAANPSLAWGEYTFDVTNSCEPGTFSDDFSGYVSVDADGNETRLSIKVGKVVVVDGGIDALLTLEDDTMHHVVYNGDLTLGYLSNVSHGPYSTLTGDYSFDIKDGAMTLLYDGDDLGIGRGSWDVRFMAKEDLSEGDFFRFIVAVDDISFDEELVYRSFVHDANATYAAGTFKQGRLDDELNFSGSWYLPLNKGAFTATQAAIAGGSFTIEHYNVNEALVTVDVVDDRGNKITGKCHCKMITVMDRTSM